MAANTCIIPPPSLEDRVGVMSDEELLVRVVAATPAGTLNRAVALEAVRRFRRLAGTETR